MSSLPPCPSDPNATFDNCFGNWEWDDGDRYVGEWKKDMKHGQGTYTFSNGNKYVGLFKDNKKNGQGTFTFSDGEIYFGEYKEDKRQGQPAGVEVTG